MNKRLRMVIAKRIFEEISSMTMQCSKYQLTIRQALSQIDLIQLQRQCNFQRAGNEVAGLKMGTANCPKSKTPLWRKGVLLFFAHLHLLFGPFLTTRGAQKGPVGAPRAQNGSRKWPQKQDTLEAPGCLAFGANCGSHFERLGFPPGAFGPPGGPKGTQNRHF